MNLFWKGHYRIDVQDKLTLSYGETIAVWCSCDALILKVLTRIIQDNLKPFLSKSCYHLKGHGGLKGAIRDVMKHCPKYKFFCKTDVKSYYDSIDHYTLLMKLHNHIHDSKIIGYVWQFLNRCVESGGLYRDMRKGIPRGSSLSPLLGAFYLLGLDRKLKKMDVKYFRFMDDILILAPSRWKLKKAIRLLNQTFNELKLEKHPDKTLLGRTERGFDFLGYFIKPGRLSVSLKTIKNFAERIARLYEQGADSVRIGQYVLKWVQWVRAGNVTITPETSSITNPFIFSQEPGDSQQPCTQKSNRSRFRHWRFRCGSCRPSNSVILGRFLFSDIYQKC
jgi:hypothetical protein